MKHIAWSGPCGTNHTIMEKGIWADNNKRGGLRKDLMAMSREEMWTSDGNWERLKEPTSGTGDWIGNWRRLSKKSNCSKGWEMPFMTWIKSLLGIMGRLLETAEETKLEWRSRNAVRHGSSSLGTKGINLFPVPVIKLHSKRKWNRHL